MNIRFSPLLLAVLLCGCYMESRPVYRSRGVTASSTPSGFTERGEASYYGEAFHGRTTANGETFDMYDLTCAHPSLPFDTVLEVTNLDNGSTVTVRVNDRGPYAAGRIVDLSRAAAEELGMLVSGTASVELVVLQ